MVQLIVGKKGKGKTKQLLDKVNSEVKNVRVISYTLTKVRNICMNSTTRFV